MASNTRLKNKAVDNLIPVIAYGVDYCRFVDVGNLGIQWFQHRFEYLDLVGRYYHGQLCVNISGAQLEVMRLVERVDLALEECALSFQVSRLDVFVDVAGVDLDKVAKTGTVIMNDGRIETIYSANLSTRGDHTAFSRVYDACAAGHYEDSGIWRIETELKREKARAILNAEGWQINPVRVLLHYAMLHFGVEIFIDDLTACDVNAPGRRIESSRERFYLRYGKGILRDIESMGKDTFYEYILQCVKEKGKLDERKASKNDIQTDTPLVYSGFGGC